MAAAKKAAGSQAITLHDHIKELRNRFFLVAIVFVVASAVAYNYKDFLIHYLLKPLGDEKLIYLNPAGGFSFIFQVTMYVGMAVAVPFLIYNLYKFVSPALPERAQKHSALVMISSLVLLSIGVAFGYLIAIPGALNFLNSFADGYVIPSLTADSYLNFILAYTAGLGILFQLPLILLLLHWIHPLKPSGLLKFERWMILIAFVAAAMITPTPDIMNQLVIALPIILMYQIGFVAICISIAKAKQRAKPAKVSRSVRKAQQKAAKRSEKLAKKSKSRGHTKHSAPERKPAIPAMPHIPELTHAVHAKTVHVAAQPAVVRKRRPVMDVMGPVKKKPIVHPAPSLTSTVQPIASQPVSQPSQMRKSMDVMIQPAVTTTTRGSITRPGRPMQPRVQQLQVPQRQQPRVTMGGMTSVDGVTLVS